jgi:glycosyltransferase involved in cell wall biosynthesis
MRLGVAHRVLFRGVESAPVRAFQAADVFVYPSRYDPFGLVVSEAMACGLPVVVSRTIGVAEWVEHGRNGLLCDPADPGSLGRSLASLAADPGLARALGQAARQAVLQYSWDRCAARTLEVYEETILAGPDEPGRGTGQPPSQTMSRT